MPIVEFLLTPEEEAHAQRVMQKLAALPKQSFVMPYKFIDDEDEQYHEAIGDCIKNNRPIASVLQKGHPVLPMTNEHNAIQCVVNYFTAAVLPSEVTAKLSEQGKLQNGHTLIWENIRNSISANDTCVIAVTKTILAEYGVEFDDFIDLCVQFEPRSQPLNLGHRAGIIHSCSSLLGLIYHPGDYDSILNLFLACFGGYGEPRKWWEFLAGVRRSYAISDEPKITFDPIQQHIVVPGHLEEDGDDNGYADCATKDNLLYAWTLQLMLGMCGLKTEASLDGSGIQLESEKIHVQVATNGVRLVDMR